MDEKELFRKAMEYLKSSDSKEIFKRVAELKKSFEHNLAWQQRFSENHPDKTKIYHQEIGKFISPLLSILATDKDDKQRAEFGRTMCKYITGTNTEVQPFLLSVFLLGRYSAIRDHLDGHDLMDDLI